MGLRAVVLPRARSAVAQRVRELTFRQALAGFCGNGPDRLGHAHGGDSQCVLTAARLGDLALFEPLFSEWKRLQAAGELGTDHCTFVMSCLAELALLVDTSRGNLLFEQFQPRFKVQLAPHGTPWLDVLARRIVLTVFSRVSGKHLAWFAALFRDEKFRRECARLVGDQSVPVARARMLLDPRIESWRARPRLYLAAPHLLVALWRAGPMERRAAQDVLAQLVGEHFDRVFSFVDEGVFPPEFVAEVRSVPNFAVLDRLSRRLSGLAAWQERLSALISSTPAGEAETDLRLLRRFAQSSEHWVALAAAKRARSLGEEGRALCLETLARLLSLDDPFLVVPVVDLGLRTEGFELTDLAATCACLRRVGDWSARVAVDALELRFGGLDPRKTQSGYPGRAFVKAGIDVELGELRTALGAYAVRRLPELIDRGTIPTAVSSLQLAGEFEAWLSLPKTLSQAFGADPADVETMIPESVRARVQSGPRG